MGIQDRDWYRDAQRERDAHYYPKQFRGSARPSFDRSRPSRPPSYSGLSSVVIALAWVGVIALLFLVFKLLGR